MSKSILTELVSVRTLEKILDNFSSATGLGCVIRDPGGRALTKGSNTTRLWSEVVKHPEIEKKYQDYLLQMFEKVAHTGQNEIYKRYIDTYAFIVPIYIEGRAEAFFVGGLGRFGNPNMEICIEEAKRLNIDIDLFLEMYLMLPLVNHEKLESCASLLRIIGSTISTLAKEGTEAKAKLEELSEIQDFLEAKIQQNSRKLHETEEKYHQLVNLLTEGVYITDEKGFIRDINIRGAKLLGYGDPSEIIGTNMRDLYINPEDRDEFTRILYWKGTINRFHPHIRMKNGRKTHIEADTCVLKDKNGKITGVQGIFRPLPDRNHSGLKNPKKKKIHHESEPADLSQNKNNQKPSQTAGRIGD